MKRAGAVTVTFLPAMRPGYDQRAFMAALEETIEAESARLADKAALVRADAES